MRCSTFTSTAPRRSALLSRPRSLQCRAAIYVNPTEVPRLCPQLDDELSNRDLELDPMGYFIIFTDTEKKEIVAEWYTNTINKGGVACDPDTGKPIPCTPGYRRLPKKIYRGRSSKELSVIIFEKENPVPVSSMIHANYLGREFEKAEQAILKGVKYCQD